VRSDSCSTNRHSGSITLSMSRWVSMPSGVPSSETQSIRQAPDARRGETLRSMAAVKSRLLFGLISKMRNSGGSSPVRGGISGCASLQKSIEGMHILRIADFVPAYDLDKSGGTSENFTRTSLRKIHADTVSPSAVF